MKKLLLVGAGSGSREVLMLVDRINAVSTEWEVVGFLDDNPELVGSRVDGYPVLPMEHESPGGDVYVASGILDADARKRLLDGLSSSHGYRLASLIAPDVVVPRDFVAGPGCIIMPGVTISFDVQLARCVFVLWGVALGHHLRVGEFSTLLSFCTVTGGCSIGPRTTIGAKATLSIDVHVGEDCLIGVGTTVLRNVADGKRLVALPRQIETERS